MMIQYKDICADELDPALFQDFIRRQVVTDCWRKIGDTWQIKHAPFIDDWSKADYQTLIGCLKNTLQTGGLVHGAFADGRLKGFVSVEPGLFGGEQRYLDLSSLHVSADMRGKGIGRALFLKAKEWAREQGAKKLYISSHSAAETQAFYQTMGCVDAQVYAQAHVEAEPYDRQLECAVYTSGR